MFSSETAQKIVALENHADATAQALTLASSRSAGKKMAWQGGELEVGLLGPDSFEGVDIAFFSAGGGQSREFGPAAAKAGAMVYARMHDTVHANAHAHSLAHAHAHVHAHAHSCAHAHSRIRTYAGD